MAARHELAAAHKLDGMNNTPEVPALVMDRRFRDPSPEEIEALTLDAMRDSIMSQLRPDNLEVSIVGDVDASEVGTCRRCGTLRT
jgi:hypothetical protein